MTEHPTEPTKSIIDDMDDLELIVNYLNGRLDPERVEAVRRRLDEDAAFRELVAPLILTWSVPDDLEEYPRPEGEAEQAWEKFKQRPGFALGLAEHEAQAARDAEAAPPRSRWHRVRHWRHWKGLRVLVLLLTGAWLIGAQMMYSSMEGRAPEVATPGYSVVPYDTGWISLYDGIEVQLAPGASLQVGHQRVRNMQPVLLAGTARFRVHEIETFTGTLRSHALLIETKAGEVAAGESDFSITVRADTTLVQVHPLGPRRALQPERMTVMTTVVSGNSSASLPLRDLEGARMVVGQVTKRIPTPR